MTTYRPALVITNYGLWFRLRKAACHHTVIHNIRMPALHGYAIGNNLTTTTPEAHTPPS